MKECDRLKYVSSGKVSYIYDKWLDTDLLPYLDDELRRKEPRKLIILHTVGSHWYYNTHFTDEYQKFIPVTNSKILSSNTFEQIRNSYDNTILFSDYFWNQVIKRLKKRNAVLIYLSDHGECMGEDGHFIHGSVDNEPQHLHGSFVWYSDIFASKYHDKVDALLFNKDKRYKSYFLFHSILDAADIKTEYIDNHLQVCARIKKPLVMEEFGYPRDGFSFSPSSTAEGRDGYYKYVFSLVGDNAETGGYFAGCNFWGWGGFANPKHEQWQVGDDYTGDPAQEAQGLNSVFSSDHSTLLVVKSQVDRMNKIGK